jgi:hypothetical protein
LPAHPALHNPSLRGQIMAQKQLPLPNK